MEKELKGGFLLLSDIIDRLIVTYVGRSTDLNRRLKEHLSDKERYIWFWYSLSDSDYEAYLQECKDYHNYGKVHTLNNSVHPAKVVSTNKCPVCGE